MNDVLLPLTPCSSMCITGQTGSGKTRFVYRFLKHVSKMYGDEPPDRIMYCYGIYQPLFDDMETDIQNLTFHQGLTTSEELDDFKKDRKHRLIILDDLAHRLLNDSEMELLFTQGCHHRRISVIFITQNLFHQGSKARTIALNTYYTVLLKNVRDISQIGVLGRQLFPGRGRLLTEAYSDATKEPFGYLLVDTFPMQRTFTACARTSFLGKTSSYIRENGCRAKDNNESVAK